MALKSSTFKVVKTNRTTAAAKASLERRHKGAIDKVVSDARTLAEDRRTALKSITSPALRTSASR